MKEPLNGGSLESRRRSYKKTIAFFIKDYYFIQKHINLKVMELPKDAMMLFSFINMRLRDFYPSLDALCDDMHVDKNEIVARLKEVGFEYNAEQNKLW